jgi:UDP-2,4-diacetamido-2,4,6-trideoxy-beta-L-altropyranose hydrolase
MRIAIRADAATHIGIGHVMRCLTLANALKMNGAEVSFVCRPFAWHLGERITAEGHGLYLLPPPAQTIKPPDPKQTPPHAAWLGENWEIDLAQTQIALNGKQFDWLIVDHYSLDNRWENEMRKFACKIMVIDDLADRRHDCDLLLDQTLGRKEGEYQHWVTENCTLLTGSKYALLRPEFVGLREYSLKRREKSEMKHLLICMGGVDQSNFTGQILDALQTSILPSYCHITVVMGENAPWIDSVRKRVEKLTWPTEINVNVGNIAQMMADSDLAIGAAGSASWERCFLGLPTLMIVLAENQRDVGIALEQKQAVILLNKISDVKKAIELLCYSDEKLKSMSQASKNITDGCGVKIILKNMEQLCV